MVDLAPPPSPPIGSLIRARGRDWVVLPNEKEHVVRLRPLTGGEDDIVGIFLPIERGTIEQSQFPLLGPTRAGDATAGLLRDALRLSFRGQVRDPAPAARPRPGGGRAGSGRGSRGTRAPSGPQSGDGLAIIAP